MVISWRSRETDQSLMPTRDGTRNALSFFVFARAVLRETSFTDAFFLTRHLGFPFARACLLIVQVPARCVDPSASIATENKKKNAFSLSPPALGPNDDDRA
jgi:hypothetical protein